MGFFSKLFKGPEIDMEKSNANAEKMRLLFNQAVENGADYQLIFAYTEDVSRFNYGFVHGSKTKVGNLIVGWNEAEQTIVALPTVPALSGCGAPTYYRRSEILKAYRNKYPTDAFIIYPDRKSYIGINACDWLEDESLYVCVTDRSARRFHRFFYEPFCQKVIQATPLKKRRTDREHGYADIGRVRSLFAAELQKRRRIFFPKQTVTGALPYPLGAP